MKKTTIVTTIVIILALVGIAFWLVASKEKTLEKNVSENLQPQQQSAGEEVKSEKNIVSSIKDAMGLGAQMKCDYSVTSDGKKMESTAYVEGEKFKSVSVVLGKTVNTVFDGTSMYIWTEGEKKGTKMVLSCLEELKSSMPSKQDSSSSVQSPDDQFKNAVDVNCSPASGTDFSVPSDVIFSDQCEMMKKSLDSIKSIQEKIPANLPSSALPKY